MNKIVGRHPIKTNDYQVWQTPTNEQLRLILEHQLLTAVTTLKGSSNSYTGDKKKGNTIKELISKLPKPYINISNKIHKIKITTLQIVPSILKLIHPIINFSKSLLSWFYK